MKILFLFPYPKGLAASQRFRFEQYLPALDEVGFRYELKPFLNERTWNNFYKRGFFFQKAFALITGIFKRLALFTQIAPYDFIFIHREAMPIGPPVIEWFLARWFKKKIIYDFDDAIWIANSSDSNRFFAFLKFHSNVFRIASLSYNISAGNGYLKNALLPYNNKVIVNPTTIDTDTWHDRLHAHDNDELVLGWTGSHSTLKYLAPFFKVLQRMKEIRNVRFLVISDEPPMENQELFEFIPWKKETEITDLLRFNIGVMPLTHDPWSEGKCGFKALQYMALGMPALVSPVGVNAEIVQHGENGFVCSNEEEWIENILKLLDDRDLVKRLGQAARKRIEDAYSVKSNTSNFLNLFR